MNKIIAPAALLLLLFTGCKEATTTTAADETVVLPMETSYKGKMEIGTSANVVTVMQWNKWLSERNLDSAFTTFADSVTIDMADGTRFDLPKDSIKNVMAGWLSTMKSINIKYIAAMPLNNTTNKDEWVLSWTDESYEYNDGKKEHVIIHEDYRMVNGKIRQVLQYARKLPPPPPPAPAK